MNTKQLLQTTALALTCWLQPSTFVMAAPLGTAFTYQGQLTDGGNPANGSYDLKFSLYNDGSGGSTVAESLTNSAVSVSNGLFMVTLDFGSAYDGNARWLQIGVRPSGSAGDFATLTPRQLLTPAPYACYAPGAGVAATANAVAAANVTGTLAVGQLPAAVVTNNASSVNLSGSFSGNGGGLTNLNAAQLASGTIGEARLSTNVALRNAKNIFGSTNVFTAAVGIACANPSQALQVGDINLIGSQGIIRLASRASSGEGYLRTWDIGVPETGTNLTGVGYSFVIDDTQVGNDPEFMIKYGTGRVGIGRTNPATALDVNGTVTATGFAGNASGLTNLNASQLTAGIVPLVQLPAAVITNHETGVTLSGTFTGNGGGLAGLNGAAIQTGTIGTSQLAAGAVTTANLAPGIGIVPPGTLVLSATASNAALTAAGYAPQLGMPALGANWTQATNAAPWAKRDNFGALSHNGQLWVLGGEIGLGVPANDVWSSSNGITWAQATAAAPWIARYLFAAVTFSNRMWVLGGQGESTLLHDIWSSSNGVAWTQVTNAAPWSARIAHSAVVLNDKMWVLGGSDGSIRHDVWSSSDGLTWTQATSAAPWSARYGHGALAFNNQLWVLGGFDGIQNFHDVWCSSNGVTWVQVTSAAAWDSRAGFGAVACDGQMWVLGGYSDFLGFAHDVWSSSDGLAWTRVTNAGPWLGRANLGAVAHNNQIWVLAGVANNVALFNDVWFSQPPSISMLGAFYLYQKQ